MARERKELDRRWLWLGAAIVLVVVFFSVRSLTREHLSVRVARAERSDMVSTVPTNGRVEPERNYEKHSPIATTVQAVYVKQGDKVPAGKLLLVLDDLQARARLASAESGVKTAQAMLDAATHNGTQEQRQASEAEIARERLDLDQAQRNLDALVKLNASGAASLSEVTAARQQVAAAQQTLSASEQTAQNRYSSAEIARAHAAVADAQATEAAAREVLAETQYRAPITGTVYRLDTKPTEFAEEGKLLLQIADLSHEQIRAYFDEPEIGRLAVGQPIEIKWDAKPGKIWTGHIVQVPITVTTYGTRNVGEVIIKIDGDDGGLLPDTNVTVTVTTSSANGVLTVPRDALFTDNGKPYVYRVVGDNLQRAPVTTGAFNLTQVAILSGLNEGDVVATGTISGQPLQVGVPIKRVE